MDGQRERDHQFGFRTRFVRWQMAEIIFYNLITISGGFGGYFVEWDYTPAQNEWERVY